jgi:probable rRNA maturation factor
MITFNYENDFTLLQEQTYDEWVGAIIKSESKSLGEINYIFCDDDYLLDINIKHLNHDYYTDIITFNYCEGDLISGDLFISTDRVKDNAQTYQVSFEEELLRVMSHGVLHLIGYNDKSEAEERIMRKKEDEKIKLFHVKL